MADDPASWRAGFQRLNKFAAPIGFASHSWDVIHAQAAHFLEHHADAAHALGWTGLELFGTHVEVGGKRPDCLGALLMAAGGNVDSVTAEAIVSGPTVYRRMPLDVPAAHVVMVWELRR